jgi:dipeptidyl aminopeptidase/acylaminoacyl peptidase
MKKHICTYPFLTFPLSFFPTLLLFLTFQTSAQELLQPETLWKLGRVNLEAVSPDGQLAVYGVTTYVLATNKSNTDLYTVTTNGGVTRKVTAFEGSEDNARFRPDGKKIGFLRDGLLWEMNLDGSDQNQVSDIEMNGFAYSPNGKQLLYIQDVKYFKDSKDIYPDLPLAKARIIDDLMYRHWKNWDDYKRSNIFVSPSQPSPKGKELQEPLNIMKDEPFDSPLQPLGGMEQIAWSADGTQIAYTCKKMNGTVSALSTNSDIFVYTLATGKTVNVSESNKGYDQNPTFSPDGKYLVWNSMLTPGYESDRNRVVCYDLATGKTTELSDKTDESMNSPMWSADSKTIYCIGGDGNATEQLHALDVATHTWRTITKGVFDFQSMALGAGNTLIGARVDMTNPSELYKIEVKTGEMSVLTHTNDALWSGIKKAKVEKRLVKTTDGKMMHVWVVLPPDFDAKKKYPALLYCQGGPQSMVSQFFSYRWNFNLMASKGYVIVAPCRRGMPGFGQKWNEAISRDWQGQAMQDLLSAIDEVKKEPYIDAAHLGAIGASAGGYATYWLAGHHEKRFKTFIAHAGLFNLESWYGMTEEVFFAQHEFGKDGYWGKDNKDFAVASPHRFVGNWDAPMLVIHGEKDFRVPVSEGMQAFQAAQLRNIPSRFLYLPEEGHWVGNPQTSVLWQRVFFEWLDKWLK